MIDKALPDRINRMDNASRDEKVIVVSSRQWGQPTEYYVLDRNRGGLELVSSQYPLLEGKEISGKQEVQYQARDGVEISAYVTEAHGKTEGGPAVVFPHGGPMARTWENFHWWSEFMASRGYTVIQPNFRGSTGYGFEFTQEAVKNWGGTMQDDLADAAKFLVDEYDVDASKICIVGASYGGFAATYAAAHQSDTFQCAVSFAGVMDLVAMRTRMHNTTSKNIFKAMVGSSTSELTKASPISYAEDVKIPVLLLHGNNDSVVHVDQSRRFANKLKKHDKNVRYVEFENETHYLEKASTRRVLLAEIEKFLAESLAQ